MTLTYTCSNGTSFNLRGTAIRTRRADFNTYKWLPQTVGRQYGAYVKSFNRDPLQYSILLDIDGIISDRKTYLNNLHACFDYDIFNMTPGRIAVGDYYIDCYITMSSTFYSKPWTQNELTVYCPYPFWQKNHVYTFNDEDGEETVNNPGSGQAEFILKINGPVGPYVCYITINDQYVGAQTGLSTGDYLTINSRDKTVIAHIAGEDVDAFNARIKNGSIFQKLKSGTNAVTWSGAKSFELTVCEERSEPLWT